MKKLALLIALFAGFMVGCSDTPKPKTTDTKKATTTTEKTTEKSTSEKSADASKPADVPAVPAPEKKDTK